MDNSNISNEELAKYDFAILIDKSGSMETKDCLGGKSRWKYAEEFAVSLATKAAEFDSDGIQVVLFSGEAKSTDNCGPEKVAQIFKENSPNGSTNTADALKLVFDGYNQRKAAGSAKPMIVLCFTDGVPNDETAVENVIIEHTKTMDEDGETGIQFIQIGKDEAARNWLKVLDDGLVAKGAKFDIVDTKNEKEMDNLSMMDILAAAVND